MAIGHTGSTLIIADGNPKYAMGGHLLFSVGNVVFNMIFVIGYDMGLGLGLGTVVTSIIFMLYNSNYFVLKMNKTFLFGKIIVDFKEFYKIIYNGLREFMSLGLLHFQ